MDSGTVSTPLSVDYSTLRTPMLARRLTEQLFRAISILATAFSLLVLGTLLWHVFSDGIDRVSWDFITGFPSRFAAKAGVLPALLGSFYLMLIVACTAFPLGIGAAIYLEEYAARTRLTRLIELNIANLAGVPSIIYGLLGLGIFVRACGFGRSLLAGGLTLSLLVLPVIIIASREALRTVPRNIREGSLALGATKWETIFYQVLPMALPGMLTGCILAISRAIGETAPLITLGALTYIPFTPDSIFSPFTALPIQTFNWLSRPQAGFHENAAAAIIVLLSVLFCLNATAIYLRTKYQRRTKF